MRIFFDTSILVAAMIESHPQHARTFPWLARVKENADIGIISAHTLAELYVTLTTYPIRPAITSAKAAQLLKENIFGVFEIVALSSEEYKQVIENLSSLGIIGGPTYDAIHLRAAANAQVDQVVTLNAKDFRRVYPSLADKVISP